MIFFSVTILFYTIQVEGTPTGEESPIELTERELEVREMEMKRLFEDRAAMMEATDRFVYHWHSKYFCEKMEGNIYLLLRNFCKHTFLLESLNNKQIEQLSFNARFKLKEEVILHNFLL